MDESFSADQAVRERFVYLLKWHTKSEIGRKTNTPAPTVSHYFNATKIPASFCALACRNLGVNPTWLLLGEGVPLLADMAKAHAQDMQGLLGIIDAMNRSTHMQLGTLAESGHLLSLRQLNDALASQEELRRKLNQKTNELFQSLVQTYGEALKKDDTERTSHIKKITEKVSYFSDDTKLRYRFDIQQAQFEEKYGSPEKSLTFYRQAFFRAFRSGLPSEAQFFEFALKYVIALVRSYRFYEARRICRSAIELVDKKAVDSEDLLVIETWESYLNVELGDVRRGLIRLLEIADRLSGEDRELASAKLMWALLLTGGISPANAFQEESYNEYQATFLARFACWLEDPDALDKMTRLLKSQGTRLDPNSIMAKHMQRLLHVINTKELPDLSDLSDRVSALPAPERFLKVIQATQLCRLADQRDQAMRLLLNAEEIRHQMEDGETLGITISAVHYRNAIELLESAPGSAIEANLLQTAHQFFNRAYEVGYTCFKPIMTKSPQWQKLMQ